ncbi:aminotransferase class I/II-fold pyridoxal phosphate-dependent enzyme, partial [Mixta calida]
MSWQHRIAEALQTRRQQQRLRQRSLLTPDGAGWLRHEGQRYRNFASNDYLGLSDDARIIDAWQQGAARYGIGAGASGHVTGYLQPHAALEAELADWLGYPCALLFNSGYAANQAVIGALAAQDDRILADKLSHASLLEAASLSPATLRRFAHNQPESLHRLLASPVGGETLVVTEGVFSMDGDSAPLSALHQLTRQA